MEPHYFSRSSFSAQRALYALSLRSCVVATALALSACASSPQKVQTAMRPAASTATCIRVEDLAEWEPLNDRSILLSVPGNPRGYLITLATPVEDLALAGDLEIIDGDLDGFICPDGADGIFAEECFCTSASIASIEYLSEKRTAELLGEAPTIL